MSPDILTVGYMCAHATVPRIYLLREFHLHAITGTNLL